jgi:hypothetical protein
LKRAFAMAKKPTKAEKKVSKVMREYGTGTLKSSSGKKVTSRKQAIAVALSEAGKSRLKTTKKTEK